MLTAAFVLALTQKISFFFFFKVHLQAVLHFVNLQHVIS